MFNLMYSAPFPPIVKMAWRATDSLLTVNWSSVAPDCPAIYYNILASNCGGCPNTTNHTTVTCTDVPINGSTCTFAVQTVVCGTIAGNWSDIAAIALPIEEGILVESSLNSTSKDSTCVSSDTTTLIGR